MQSKCGDELTEESYYPLLKKTGFPKFRLTIEIITPPKSKVKFWWLHEVLPEKKKMLQVNNVSDDLALNS